MTDFTLSDGREITFDLSQISMAEYAALFDTTAPAEKDTAVIARVMGLTPEDYLAMQTSSTVSLKEWKQLHRAFFKKCREPLGDDPK
jgi:hypothetical protein